MVVGGARDDLVEVVDRLLPVRAQLVRDVGRRGHGAATPGDRQRGPRTGLHHRGARRPMPRQHQRGRPLGALRGTGDIQHRQVAVGADAITLAVAVVVGRREVLDHLGLDRRNREAEGVDHEVALGIDVLVDPVGDLQGEEGEADRAVVGAGRQPVRAVPAGRRSPAALRPEPHAMALGGGPAHLLLVGEVMAAPRQVQVRDRRLRVGAAQQRRADHRPGRGEGPLLGEHPARPAHRHVQIPLGAVDGEVDRVREHPLGGAGAAEEVVRQVDPCHQLVQAGQGDVGQQHPEAQQVQQPDRREREALDQVQQGQPDRDHHAGGDEQVVQQRVARTAAPVRGARARGRRRAPPAAPGGAAASGAPRATASSCALCAPGSHGAIVGADGESSKVAGAPFRKVTHVCSISRGPHPGRSATVVRSPSSATACSRSTPRSPPTSPPRPSRPATATSTPRQDSRTR